MRPILLVAMAMAVTAHLPDGVDKQRHEKGYPHPIHHRQAMSAMLNIGEACLKLTGAGIYRITFLSGEVEPDAPVIP
jgi:hydrogenase/urease accessory protein HupE